ncbi:uncharacterized protein STEHIDRAFT_173113 [Stereum hirsutum FP-91666 SS1]|uniref:Uncharacterized protein n=1 Tax=Stereum hirsutum (strain FP-91666) TaxID=721885 RepID=R7RXE0_STEHR|nr:uncharacterized protein STEHIDRAFT_173113 [Stereum hirsutum FP-91666 SS1]EIM79493.1 hypothetical protein STEHIDRAFT_173113 [Stereum hirsutum FP-91666 SS1]
MGLSTNPGTTARPNARNRYRPSAHHPPILSLPPASFSLSASTSACTRPTPATKVKRSTSTKAGSGATSHRVHDLGRSTKERREDVDVSHCSARGSAGPGPRMKRGSRGQFVSNTSKDKTRLVAGSGSSSGSGGAAAREGETGM